MHATLDPPDSGACAQLDLLTSAEDDLDFRRAACWQLPTAKKKKKKKKKKEEAFCSLVDG